MQARMSMREYAQARKSPEPVAPAPLTALKPAFVTPACEGSRTRLLLDMPLSHLVNGSQVIRLYSEVLGTEVLLAGREADVSLWRMQHPHVDSFVPVYQGDEIATIEGASPSFLRLLHYAKTAFDGGRILSDNETLAKPAVQKRKHADGH